MLKKLYQYIIKLIIRTDYTTRANSDLLKLNLFFLFGLIISPNNKVIFILSALFFISTFIITKSLEETIIYSFIPMSIIQVGQVYAFKVIPRESLWTFLYPEGRKLFFTFTSFTALLLTYLLTTFVLIIKNKKLPKLSSITFCLIINSLLNLLSSISSEFIPLISVFNTISSLGLVSYILISEWYFKTHKKMKIIKTFTFLCLQLSLIIIFESLIVIAQTIIRSTLGLTLETIYQTPVFSGIDQSQIIFRPMGLASHANILANGFISKLFALISTILYLNFIKKFDKQIKIISTNAVILTLIVIILAQSRAAYFSLFICILIFIIFNFYDSFKFIRKIYKNFTTHKIITLILVFISVVLVSNRVLHTLNSFGETGGIPVRQELNEVAFDLIKKYPILGVGSGMFIPAAFKLDPKGVMSYFPEAVHNGWLLLISENGLFDFLLTLLIIYLLIKRISAIKDNRLLKSILFTGLLAQFVNMFFHPFVNIVTIHTIIVILITSNVKQT